MLLAPAASLVAAATARRVARPGWRAPVPVICCGNVTVGGAGKTTVALDLGRRLRARGVAAHFLTRGYGGQERGPLRVDPERHAARRVGDEALLLAHAAPTWVAADRAAGARAAVTGGAQAVLMDDGLQNPGLTKDLSLLVVDGTSGFGNARVLPAGPLREPIAAGAARCRAAVLIGEDSSGAARLLPRTLPVLRARLVPKPDARTLSGHSVFGFAGIARPEKFRATLRDLGAGIVGFAAFPDHHPYTPLDLERILESAHRHRAIPVTTAKDAARLTPDVRALITVVDIDLEWDDASAVEALLREAVS